MDGVSLKNVLMGQKKEEVRQNLDFALKTIIVHILRLEK